MKKFILASLIAALTALPALAKDDSDSCGLGWQVTQKKTMSATTTRGTTNGFVPPTFGMTSGTIGCAKHDFAKKDQAAVIFASANFEPLMMEMAQGQGEYLTGFARTMGCSDAAVGEFSRAMQKNFNQVSSSKNSAELFYSAKEQINNNQALAALCSA